MVQLYILERANDQSWPRGLRKSDSPATTRAFFDSFEFMKLDLVVESHKPEDMRHRRRTARPPLLEYLKWNVTFDYDFSTQGHIVYTMNLHRLSPSPTALNLMPTDYIGRYMFLIAIASVYQVHHCPMNMKPWGAFYPSVWIHLSAHSCTNYCSYDDLSIFLSI
jgi:hypothetical protein